MTHNWKVKLGDFGESTTIKQESQVSDSGGRMTVLGTIAYMVRMIEGIDLHVSMVAIKALLDMCVCAGS